MNIEKIVNIERQVNIMGWFGQPNLTLNIHFFQYSLIHDSALKILKNKKVRALYIYLNKILRCDVPFRKYGR